MTREFFVVEAFDGTFSTHTTHEAAAEHAARLFDAEVYRYVPEVSEVKGWPTENGWYWCIRKPGWVYEIVELFTDGRMYANDCSFFGPENYPRIRCWGPIAPPPEVKP